jgi:hypothetical protein
LNSIKPPIANGESAGSIHAPGTVNGRVDDGKHFQMNDLLSIVDSSHGTGSRPLGEDVAEGSMAIFATREGAEEFVKEDPFVLGGVVQSWTLREWNEILAP